MRKYKTVKNLLLLLLPFAVVAFVLSSCLEDGDGSPDIKAGTPTFTSIEPTSGVAKSVVIIKGSGLGDMRTAIFDLNDAPSYITSTLNTEDAIVLNVADDAAPGIQNIVLTNSLGKSVTVPFEVLGLANITSVSNYNFSEGAEITLTGKNLDDVAKVVFTGTTEEVEVVAKTATTLTLKFPATTIPSSTLVISNKAGDATTTQQFVNLDEAFLIFTDDYATGFETSSWAPTEVSAAEVKTGSKSFKATYPKGNWWLAGFGNSTGVPEMPEYKTLNFWIKGGSTDLTLYIIGDKRTGGWGNSDQSYPILVPGNVWTYFRIPLSDLQLWKTGAPFHQLGWWIKGPDNQDETFYFDDVIFVK